MLQYLLGDDNDVDVGIVFGVKKWPEDSHRGIFYSLPTSLTRPNSIEYWAQSHYFQNEAGADVLSVLNSGHVEMTGTLYQTERAAAAADYAGKGQIWVKNTTPNVLYFTDDAGTDWDLLAAGAGGLANVVEDVTPQLGANLDVNGFQITSAAAGNIVVIADTTGKIGIGTASPATTHGVTIGRSGNNAVLLLDRLGSTYCWLHMRDASTTGNSYVGIGAYYDQLLFKAGNAIVGAWTGTEFSVGGQAWLLSFFSDQKAAADTDLAGKGQFWCKNSVPIEAMYTNEAGTDITLSMPRYVKTANYTITGGAEDVGVDSTGGTFTITLKASPVSGDHCIIRDVAQNCGTTNVAIARNGSTINGVAADENLDVDNGMYMFVYNGSTWKFTPFSGPGLNEAEVKAVTSGTQRWFLRPGVDLVVGPSAIPTYAGGQTLVTSYWNVNVYTMSATLDKHVYWTVPLPPRYALGTFRFRWIWAADTTNVGVVRWVVYPMAAAVGDLETPSDALGTPQVVDDTSSGVVNRIQYTDWSAAVTHAGAANDKLLCFILMRQGSAGADTFTGAGKLLGVEVEWTSDQPTDA